QGLPPWPLAPVGDPAAQTAMLPVLPPTRRAFLPPRPISSRAAGATDPIRQWNARRPAQSAIVRSGTRLTRTPRCPAHLPPGRTAPPPDRRIGEHTAPEG